MTFHSTGFLNVRRYRARCFEPLHQYYYSEQTDRVIVFLLSTSAVDFFQMQEAKTVAVLGFILHDELEPTLLLRQVKVTGVGGDWEDFRRFILHIIWSRENKYKQNIFEISCIIKYPLRSCHNLIVAYQPTHHPHSFSHYSLSFGL